MRERVDVGDLQAVEDQAGGGGAAHAHGDAARPGELGEVVHHQHVVREPRIAHHVQLILEPATRLLGDRIVAPFQAGRGQVREVLVRGEAGGQVGVGQVQAAELQLQVARLRDALGVVHRLRQLGEAGADFGLGLHVVDRRVHAHALLVQHRGVGADAEENVVVRRVVRVNVVAVDGGDEGYAGLTGELDELLVDRRHLRQAVLLQLEVVSVERLARPVRQLQGVVATAVHEQPVDLAGVAAGEGDEAATVLFQQLPVHARLIVVALQVGLGDQRQQVAIACLVASEQRQVVGRLLLRVARAAVAGGNVRLDADDGLDTPAARLLIEVEGAVEGAVVGDGAGLLPQLLCAVEELGDAGEAIEEAVLGMKVKVRKHLNAFAESSTAIIAARAPWEWGAYVQFQGMLRC